jgi:serine/threonine-protein kinase HipA
MISEPADSIRPDGAPDEAFVWTWLPDRLEPVVAGRLVRSGGRYLFNYGKSYLAIEDRVAIYTQELPLIDGIIAPITGLSMAGCLRDASPDAWGRRVIINRLFGHSGRDTDSSTLDELTYLLQSGSDRIGALDFQRSSSKYTPRGGPSATLEELQSAAERVEKGIPLNPELDEALFHGSSIGGARPKAMLEDNQRKLIAKFSSSTDTYNVVKAEFVAMRLAAAAGLDVARVQLERVAGKDVLLIERFDRDRKEKGWLRRGMVSALTLLGLDEMMARYASYTDLAEIVRHRFAQPRKTLHEVFGRMVFNILCGNTDDHARNHAAFWDGQQLKLTPAYDICPQNRTVNEASQAMLIVDDLRMSTLANCLQAAPHFQLDRASATAIIQGQVEAIRANWQRVCEEAQLNDIERKLLARRMFLNEFIFQDAPASIKRAVL